MKKAMEILAEEGLAFFGRINAVISHELKNIMATISETVGLMGDLVELAEKDGKLDAKMLKSCSQEVIDEIQRGFATIKQMNTFAHSVDEPVKEVEVDDVLELVVKLSQFMSFASRVHFERSEGIGLKVFTSPFLLEDLMYQALISVYKAAGPDEEIRISVRPDERGVRIVISGTGSLDAFKFPDKNANRIAGVLGVEVLTPSSSTECHIILPHTIDNI